MRLGDTGFNQNVVTVDGVIDRADVLSADELDQLAQSLAIDGNAALAEAIRRSADCHQPDGRVHPAPSLHPGADSNRPFGDRQLTQLQVSRSAIPVASETSVRHSSVETPLVGESGAALTPRTARQAL